MNVEFTRYTKIQKECERKSIEISRMYIYITGKNLKSKSGLKIINKNQKQSKRKPIVVKWIQKGIKGNLKGHQYEYIYGI